MGLKVLLLVFVCLGATTLFSWIDEVRKAPFFLELSKDSARPVDLSSNGRFILTVGDRKNPEHSGRLSVLSVYDTGKGKSVGKPVIEAERSFRAATLFHVMRAICTTPVYPIWFRRSANRRIRRNVRGRKRLGGIGAQSGNRMI